MQNVPEINLPFPEMNRMLYESMPLGAAFQDAEGSIITANPAAQEILGLSLEQLQGLTSRDPRWRAIYPDGSEFAGDNHPAMEALRSGQPVHNVVMGVFNPAQMAYRWININAIPQFKQAGEAPYLVITTFEDITARWQAEQELKNNAAKFSAAFHSGPLGMAIFAPDGKYREINRATSQLIGYESEEVIGKSAFELGLIEQSTLLEIRSNIKTAGGFLDNWEMQLRDRQGRLHDILYSIRPMNLNQQTHYLTAVLDISDRKQAEAALKEKQQILQLYVEHAPAAIAMFDHDMRYIVTSRRYLVDYGLGDQQLTGRSHYDIFPELTEQVKEIHRRCLQGAVEKMDEDAFIRADGSTDWVYWEIHPWYREDNQIGGIIFFSEVITKRKQAEQKLIESQQKYSELFLKAAIPAVLVSVPHYEMVDVNEAFENILGYAREDVLGHPPLNFSQVLPDQPENLDPWLAQGQLNSGMEIHLTTKTNQKIIALIKANGVEFGGQKYAIVTIQDLTALKTAEQEREVLIREMEESREQLLALSRRLLEIQENERRSLALELHDELGQTLNSIKLSLDLMMPDATGQVQKYLQHTISMTNDLVVRVRRMALELRPSMLDDLGLLPALKWLCSNYQTLTGEDLVLEHSQIERRFTPQIEVTAYRITQEALTNVLRHAGKTKLEIDIWADQSALNLQIRDYGHGFKLEEVLAGHASSGLRGMQTRVNLLGGDLFFESEPGQGTTISAWLPFKADEMSAQGETNT